MLKVGTLFSGIGAPEYALRRMGIPHKIMFACDNGDINPTYNIQEEFANVKALGGGYAAKKQYVDDLYAKTRKTNFVKKSYLANYDLPEERFFQDVCLFDGTDFRDQVDLLVAGSPCQAFSVSGERKGFEDHRGQLFFEFCRIVSEVQPRCFLWENVKGVLSHDNGRTWKTMKQTFEDLGYRIFFQVLNAKDYGIPQSRNRIFVLGFKDHDIEFKFPEPVPLTRVMKDFLDGYANSKYLLTEKGVEFVTNPEKQAKSFTQVDGEIALCQKKNQQENWHGDFVSVDDKYFLSDKVAEYVLQTGSGKYVSEPEIDHDIAHTLVSTCHKMHRSGIDNYVTDLKEVNEDEQPTSRGGGG